MTNKKVLHIVEDLKIGGLERVIASIVLGLDKTRYLSLVWCLSRGGEIAEELTNKGVEVKILGMNSYHNPLQIIALSRLIKKSKIDIIHTHGYFGSTFGRLAALLARTPIIIAHVHTTYYGFKKQNIVIERILSRFTDRIVCVSKAVKEFVVKTENIPEEKTCLIYNGVERSYPVDFDIDRKNLGIEDKELVGITVASLTPHKGHRVLIDAIRIICKKHKHIKFLIVGDGPLRNNLEAYVKDVQLSSKIIFMGQRKDVASLLRLATFFVLPSTEREGLGIALVEAMSEGLPLIGTRVGGIPEVIEDNVNGLLVTPGDSLELAAAVGKLITDKAMQGRMGEMGKEIYRKKFTQARMNQSIEALYDGIIKSRMSGVGR